MAPLTHLGERFEPRVLSGMRHRNALRPRPAEVAAAEQRISESNLTGDALVYA